MAEEGLDGSDVGAVFEEMGCERVSEGVGGDSLGESGAECGSADGSLGSGGMEMMAPEASGSGVSRELSRREDPLPAPFDSGAGMLAGEGVGEFDAGGIAIEVESMERSDSLQVEGDGVSECGGEEGDTVAIAFAFSDGDLLPAGVEILGTEA